MESRLDAASGPGGWGCGPMASGAVFSHAMAMRTSTRHFADLAASAHQLQRAAGFFQHHASARDSVQNLPAALAHVEEALDRLSTGMTLAAHAVEDWSDAGTEGEAARDAHELRWHLFHLASRLKGGQERCVEPRRLARTLLEHERADGELPTATASTAAV